MRSAQQLPSVSVVVPVLNAAAEIGRAIESLLSQNYSASDNVEIIVVDNGSTDGTDKIIEQYPVTLIREHRVRSSYAARNRGVASAAGEWVAFTDADCVASAEWLRSLLSPPVPEDVGAVAGEIEALESKTPVQRLTERYGIMKHGVTMSHKAVTCFSTANVAIRRDVLGKLGGFREDIRFFGDMDLSWRMQLSMGRRILFRPEAVVQHRHRRTLGALWRHGCQHGRGVAFMRRTYPELYRIHPGEQLGRVGELAQAAGSAARDVGGLDPDRWYAPLFLATWYCGMGAGYVMGPARAEHRRKGTVS
jgi:cellulose synthase/poly-beta-1,6-N-acetylglucosamine synthase-like glycosyltransferase